MTSSPLGKVAISAEEGVQSVTTEKEGHLSKYNIYCANLLKGPTEAVWASSVFLAQERPVNKGCFTEDIFGW